VNSDIMISYVCVCLLMDKEAAKAVVHHGDDKHAQCAVNEVV
jgi:hypothetical protein